ncbi:MAG: sigma-70 family RNA polymerase sigma factor [Phycisphaerales bacterium]|nr:sigma-70 family RNA polymerase sigma factor [Phycisphaerales bacterium]
MEDSKYDATQILLDMNAGDPSASEKLFPIVYHELHRLASSHMRRQRSDHTLQPTALVHEVFLRLVDQAKSTWKDRAHFMALAATAMRQILIKHARGKNTAKRGGGWNRLTLDEAVTPHENKTLDLIALDDALVKLRELSERQCRVVELRFFCGMTIAETAEALGLGSTTVEDDWHMARAWLALELREGA